MAEVTQCIPTLQSSDASRSFSFYESLLGCTKNWEHRYEAGFPLFLSMSVGESTVFLTEHKNQSAFGAELYLFVEDIDALASTVKETGVQFELELRTTPYGTREFSILDPDGNKLRIGQHV